MRFTFFGSKALMSMIRAQHEMEIEKIMEGLQVCYSR